MTNKTLGWFLLAPIIIAVFAGVFEPVNQEGLYSFAGLGWFVFGIWGGIRLINLDK